MANLYPIRDADGSPLRYAERDWIGVEADGATHLRGLNAALAWGQRAYDAMAVEHDPATGRHRTIKIPLITLGFEYDGGYFLNRVYDRGQMSGTTAAASIFGSSLGGEIEITLNTALPTTGYRVIGMPETRRGLRPFYPDAGIAGTRQKIVVVRQSAIVDAKTFRVRRYAGEDVASLAPQHGPFFVAIHHEV